MAARLTPPPGSVPESLVVVTGLSGSGKSYVNKCLEDMGYFCVDNLPLELVEPLLGQISAARVGIILDVRNPDFAARFPEILARLRYKVPGTRLLFLNASEESLIRRFSETRRPHPLSGKVSLLEALRREIHDGLNVVENWNSANGFIFYGKGGEISTNHRDEQELAVLSLHLLQSSLVYINTLMLQHVLTEPAWIAGMTTDDLRGLTPLIYTHVNPYGTFSLDLAERLALDPEEAAA